GRVYERNTLELLRDWLSRASICECRILGLVYALYLDQVVPGLMPVRQELIRVVPVHGPIDAWPRYDAAVLENLTQHAPELGADPEIAFQPDIRPLVFWNLI